MNLKADVLTADEIGRVSDVLSERSSIGLRNRALLALLYRGGLRVSEALNLRESDCDLAGGVVKVRKSKTKAGLRLAAIDREACSTVSTWVERRRKLEIDPAAPLLCTLQGTPIYQSYVRTLLPRLAGRAHVNKRLHAHGLRHAHALELYRAGADLVDIRDQLGHANIASTDAYLRRVNQGERIARLHALRNDAKEN
jgi:site-specific recombinase XerD